MRIEKIQGEFFQERVIDSPRIQGIQLSLIGDDENVKEAMLLSAEALDALSQEQQDELMKIMAIEDTDPQGYWNELKRILIDGSGSNERIDIERNGD